MAVSPNKKEWNEWREKAGPFPTKDEPELTARKRSQFPAFIEACQEMGIKPTKRQAAKCNAGRNRWSNDRSRVLN